MHIFSKDLLMAQDNLIPVAFVRPNLSANGTMGGDSFAVSATLYTSSSTSDSSNAYKAFDSSDTTYLNGTVSNMIIKLYNPNLLSFNCISILYKVGSGANFYSNKVWGSNDGQNWESIVSFTNVNSTSKVTKKIYPSIDLSSNYSKRFKYFRINFGANSGDYKALTIYDIGITGTEYLERQ